MLQSDSLNLSHLDPLHEGSSSQAADCLVALQVTATLYAVHCLPQSQQLVPQLKLRQR